MDLCGFESSLVYRESSRATRATQRETLSQEKQNIKTTTTTTKKTHNRLVRTNTFYHSKLIYLAVETAMSLLLTQVEVTVSNC